MEIYVIWFMTWINKYHLKKLNEVNVSFWCTFRFLHLVSCDFVSATFFYFSEFWYYRSSVQHLCGFFVCFVFRVLCNTSASKKETCNVSHLSSSVTLPLHLQWLQTTILIIMILMQCYPQLDVTVPVMPPSNMSLHQNELRLQLCACSPLLTVMTWRWKQSLVMVIELA